MFLPWDRAKPANSFQYSGQHFPGHQHLSQLKHQSSSMAYQSPTRLDQSGLNLLSAVPKTVDYLLVNK